MNMIDILGFLRSGNFPGIVSVGESILEVKERLGMPTEEIGGETAGYVYYNGLRIGYFGDLVDEIAIMFYDTDGKFPVDIELLPKAYIDKNSQIHQLIEILNYANIEWHSVKEKDLDYFYIQTEQRVYLVFDLENGRINKATYTGM